MCILNPTPNLGTLFVNTIALTEERSCPLLAYFFAVSVFRLFLGRGMKSKKLKLKSKQQKKQDHKMQTRKTKDRRNPQNNVFKKGVDRQKAKNKDGILKGMTTRKTRKTE